MAEVAFNVLPTVWALGATLLILIVGVLMRLLKVFQLPMIGPLNKFCFTIGIPCLAFKSMSGKSVAELNWRFVAVFLICRVAFAVFCGIYTMIRKQNFAEFCVHYLATTWIDVITFGIPVISVVFNAKVGQLYPVLCAFSSFIFELPVVLICFNIYRARENVKKLTAEIKELESSIASMEITPVAVPPPSEKKEEEDEEKKDEEEKKEGGEEDGKKKKKKSKKDKKKKEEDEEAARKAAEEAEAKRKEEEEARRKDIEEKKAQIAKLQGKTLAKSIAKEVALDVIKTPPVDAIIIGLIWGATKVAVPTLIMTAVTNLGNCVTPVATFCVGVFLCDGAPFKRAWKKTIIYVAIKTFLFPLCAIACLYMLGIKGVPARIGVICASLPVAFPGFILAKQYGVGEDAMSTVISVGTVLMLPVTLFWWWILNVCNMFPETNVTV